MNTVEELLTIGITWEKAMVSNQVDEFEKFMPETGLLLEREVELKQKILFE